MQKDSVLFNVLSTQRLGLASGGMCQGSDNRGGIAAVDNANCGEFRAAVNITTIIVMFFILLIKRNNCLVKLKSCKYYDNTNY